MVADRARFGVGLDEVAAVIEAAGRARRPRGFDDTDGRPLGLVLGFTDSRSSADALALCWHICGALPVTVHAVYVCRPLVVAASDPYLCGVSLETRAADVATVQARLYERAGDRIPELTFRWSVGPVPVQLARAAKTADAVGVVVGGSGHRAWRWGITRVLLGPASAGVLEAPADCPWP